MAGINAVITGIFNNPTIFVAGVAGGFILAKAMQMRKRNRSGFGGGFN